MAEQRRGRNPNHPRIGDAIKVDPIRDLAAIQHIKQRLLLSGNYRNYCIFVMGINMAWRANELLSITVGQVRSLEVGDLLEIKQSKNGKYRAVPVNETVVAAIRSWLALYENCKSGPALKSKAPLFPSQKGGVLGVPALCNLVKKWCYDTGLEGNFGSHTLRKTWGYHQRFNFGSPIPLLMKAYGHSSERETLRYLGIQASEVAALYSKEL